MITVVQAFERMRQDLELTDAEQKTASNQEIAVRDKLKERLGGIAGEFPSGSYARRTAIRPLHDIDLFVVLDPAAHRDVYPSDKVLPSACLKKVHRALADAYPSTTTIQQQDHSVNIVFSGTGIGFDVVPAFANKADVYIIPDRGRDAWIQTNPKAHHKALTLANEKAGDKLNPLIKMAKQWKVAHGVPLRSFYLEVMSYGAFTSAPASYPEGARALFGHLAGAVLKACPDPAGVGPNIDAGMTQEARTKLREKLLEAEKKAGEALALDMARRTEEAHRTWKWLFGKAYPEG
jgi:predicted nucleotidyltransferase